MSSSSITKTQREHKKRTKQARERQEYAEWLSDQTGPRTPKRSQRVNTDFTTAGPVTQRAKSGALSVVPALGPTDYQKVVKVRRRSTVSQRTRLAQRQNWRCWWCDCQLPNDFHVDHRVPIVLGGSNREHNLCASCPDCNLRKGAKIWTRSHH